MRRIFTRIFPLLWLMAGAITGCQLEVGAEQTPRAGQLGLVRYVAWGDGYTAGFRDAPWEPNTLRGLYTEAQSTAYPSLLAQQFEQVAPLEFSQMPLPGDGSGYLSLVSIEPSPCPNELPVLTFDAKEATAGWNEPVTQPVDNYGVPHLRLSEIDRDSLALANPFAGRLRIPTSYLTLMADRNYGFATIWLGVEEILAHAMTGASNVGYPVLNSGMLVTHYAQVLEAMQREGEKPHFVIGNLPDVTNFPFFTTLPVRHRSVENCQRAPASVYGQKGTYDEVSRLIPDDLLLLSAEASLGLPNSLPGLLGLDIDNPLPNTLVLDAEERADIQAHIQRCNESLDSLVAVHNQEVGYQQVVIANMCEQFDRLSQGVMIDGLSLSTTHLYGSIFSTDGLYLTPRGNAYVANAFIEAINGSESWDAQIPTLTLTDFSGVTFP